MALNIKNPEVEALVDRVVSITGESKTEAVRRALAERAERLGRREGDAVREQRIRRFLESEIWSRIPEDQMGRMPDREERERILGYGREGV